MAPVFTKRKRVIYFFLLGILFIIGVPILLLYSLGYRLGDGWALEPRGGVYVTVPQSRAEIHVNGTYRMRTQFLNHDYFTQELVPGVHTVHVSHPLHYSWNREVVVRPQSVTPLYPFLVPRTYEKQEIVMSDHATSTVATSTDTQERHVVTENEYELISSLFDITAFSTTSPSLAHEALFAGSRVEETATITPAQATPDMIPADKRIAHGNTIVWFDGYTIYAYWDSDTWVPQRFCNTVVCSHPMPVITSDEPITHVDFYPGRDDVILFATSDSIQVGEIDRRPGQVHRTIISGEDIDFRIEDNQLYFKEGEMFYELII